MITNLAPPDILLLGAMVGVAVVGIVSVEEISAGFANEAVLTLGALFVVAAGLRETGALDLISSRMLGRARSERGALLRISLPVVGVSAFMNNTPVVAMAISILTDWCRKHRISPSRLLMPLSILAILGGTCTLIGTSTNLVVNQLMRVKAAQAPPAVAASLAPMSLFEMAWVGVPFAIVGILYLLFVAPRLLPDRKDLLEQLGDSPREYLANMIIRPGCRLIGQSVEAAGLRRLTGLFLIEIERSGQIVAPVRPDEILHEADRLTFTGVVRNIVDLERIGGLVPEATAEDAPAAATALRERKLCEAVVSGPSPLLGRTIRDADFRARYNAAVLAVHRGGERIKGRIGDIVARPGDTLLLQTGPHFARAYRNSTDFFLVSNIEKARPVRHDRAVISLTLMGLLVVLLMSAQWVPTAVAALFVAGLMVVTRCISATAARASVQWQVLLAIAAALTLGKAMENSGAAAALAGGLVAGMQGWPVIAVLSMVFAVTAVCTTFITNTAAVALLFPLAIDIALRFGADPRPFAMAIAFAAALSFSSPIGYQTNIMIYGPGGYRFGDFVRVGLPLNIILWVIGSLLIPFFWPLATAV